MTTLMSEYELPGDGEVDYGNPLSPEESLDEDEFGEDIADGYSPTERPWGVSAWGVTSTRRPGMKAWDVAGRVNGASSPTSPKGTESAIRLVPTANQSTTESETGEPDASSWAPSTTWTRARTIGPPTLASMGLAPRPKRPPFMSCQTASRPTVDDRSSMRALSRKSSRSPMLKRWNI